MNVGSLPKPPTPEQEEKALLDRLERFQTIHVARLAGKEAAVELQRRGLVSIEHGQGEDQGLFLVRRTIGSRAPNGGGAA